MERALLERAPLERLPVDRLLVERLLVERLLLEPLALRRAVVRAGFLSGVTAARSLSNSLSAVRLAFLASRSTDFSVLPRSL